MVPLPLTHDPEPEEGSAPTELASATNLNTNPSQAASNMNNNLASKPPAPPVSPKVCQNSFVPRSYVSGFCLQIVLVHVFTILWKIPKLTTLYFLLL
jgi:hypothetical protein